METEIAKNKKIEIDGWFNEKALNSFVDLAKGAILAKELTNEIVKLNLSDTDREKINFLVEEINSNLYSSLYDMVKVVSCLNLPFESHTAFDAQEILEKGEEGLANVLIKHGCSKDLSWLGLNGVSSEDKAKTQMEVSNILEQVKNLVKSSSREVRTEINYLLLNIRESPKAKIILELLEPVTQGEKSWELFQREVKKILADI